MLYNYKGLFTVEIFVFLLLFSVRPSIRPDMQKTAWLVAKTRLRQRGDGKSVDFSNLNTSDRIDW